MNARHLFLLVALSLGLPALAVADAPDQASDCVNFTGGAALINHYQPLGQTFQPAQSSLTAVELNLAGFNGDPPTGTVVVNIRDGGTLAGTILGTSTITAHVIPFDEEEWVRFEFSPAVTVVPDATYMIEVSSADPGLGIVHSDCGYTRGEAFDNDASPESEFVDYQFRTFGPCGNGQIDAGEDCDNGSSSSADCCATATCLYESNGTSCNGDANECTLEVCGGASAVCSTPDGNASDGAPCDDGSLCTSESCDGSGACVAAPAPDLTCEGATKTSLDLVQSAKPGKDKIKFKWNKGVIADIGQVAILGVAADDAALCVYANGGSTMVSNLQLPANSLWQFKGNSGLQYKDKTGSVGGTTAARFKVDFTMQPKSQLSWQAGGLNLTSLNMSSMLTGPVIAQVVTGAGGCWGAEFTGAVIKKNDGAVFKAANK